MVLCTVCFKSHSGIGKLCSNCLELHREERERRRLDLIICVRCGKKNDLSDGGRQCSKCREYCANHWRKRKQDPTFQVKKSQRDKEYRIEHFEHLSMIRRAYYQTHKQQMIEKARLWSLNNPERVRRVQNAARRLRRQNLDYRKKEWEKEKNRIQSLRPKIYFLLGGKCAKCLLDDSSILHLDHIQPVLRTFNKLGRGGGYPNLIEARAHPERFQLLCPNDHRRKLYLQDLQIFANKRARITRESFVPHSRWKTFDQYQKHLEMSKTNFRKRREKAIEFLGGRCAKCGISDNIVLEFDHKKPLFRMTSGYGRRSKYDKLKDIMTYPEKYQLLCATCHEKKRIMEDLPAFRALSKNSILLVER